MKRLFSIVALLLVAVAHAAPVDPIGKDASGRVVPATRVLTSLLSGPLTCDVSSSALPTGAATESTLMSVDSRQSTANGYLSTIATNQCTATGQTSGNGYLSSIDNTIALLNAKFGALGQQLAAASAPVVLPAAQIALLTQASQLPASLVGGRLDVNVGASTPLSVTGPLTDTQLRATPVPVSGTVTASGGATSANQTSGGQKTQVVDGSGNVQPAGDSVTRPIYQSRVGASSFQLLTGLTAGTTLLSGAGTLRKVCVFIPSSGGSGGFYVYDNTAASGTAIVSLFTTTSTCYDLDVRFGKGLTVQMTTAAATVLMTWDTH